MFFILQYKVLKITVVQQQQTQELALSEQARRFTDWEAEEVGDGRADGSSAKRWRQAPGSNNIFTLFYGPLLCALKVPATSLALDFCFLNILSWNKRYQIMCS